MKNDIFISAVETHVNLDVIVALSHKAHNLDTVITFVETIVSRVRWRIPRHCRLRSITARRCCRRRRRMITIELARA